jgi:hypothetical protein
LYKLSPIPQFLYRNKGQILTHRAVGRENGKVRAEVNPVLTPLPQVTSSASSAIKPEPHLTHRFKRIK